MDTQPPSPSKHHRRRPATERGERRLGPAFVRSGARAPVDCRVVDSGRGGSLFDAVLDRDPECSTVTLSGELDLASAPQLRGVLEDLAADPSAQVRIDMQALTFLDSSGISALVEGQKELESKGTSVELVGVREHARRVLDVAGLGDFFRFTDAPG